MKTKTVQYTKEVTYYLCNHPHHHHRKKEIAERCAKQHMGTAEYQRRLKESKERAAKIIKAYKDGSSMKEISKLVGRSIVAVQSVVNREMEGRGRRESKKK